MARGKACLLKTDGSDSDGHTGERQAAMQQRSGLPLWGSGSREIRSEPRLSGVLPLRQSGGAPVGFRSGFGSGFRPGEVLLRVRCPGPPDTKATKSNFTGSFLV